MRGELDRSASNVYLAFSTFSENLYDVFLISSHTVSPPLAEFNQRLTHLYFFVLLIPRYRSREWQASYSCSTRVFSREIFPIFL